MPKMMRYQAGSVPQGVISDDGRRFYAGYDETRPTVRASTPIAALRKFRRTYPHGRCGIWDSVEQRYLNVGETGERL